MDSVDVAQNALNQVNAMFEAMREAKIERAPTAITYEWTGPGGLKVKTGIQVDEAHDIVEVGEDLCLCFGPRKLTPAEACLVRRSASTDAPAYDSIYGRSSPPFVIGGGSDSPDAAAG